MENKIKRWWTGIILTCEEVTRLSFDTPDQIKLTFAEKLKLKLHRSMCVFCRRYYKQTKFLREAMKKHQQKSADGVYTNKKLSDEAKEKIKKNLRDSAE